MQYWILTSNKKEEMEVARQKKADTERDLRDRSEQSTVCIANRSVFHATGEYSDEDKILDVADLIASQKPDTQEQSQPETNTEEDNGDSA